MSEKILCRNANLDALAECRRWATDLVLRESRGPGDTENAMHRLEARFGIPWRVLWSLRYRPPVDVYASTHERLRQAWLASRAAPSPTLTDSVKHAQVREDA